MAQVMKSRMAFHDVTQGDMAAAMGISQSQLSKILRAERTIDLEAFEASAKPSKKAQASLSRKRKALPTSNENARRRHSYMQQN